MHAPLAAHRKAIASLIALAGSATLLLAAPAAGHAEESNPNNYSCLGSLTAGSPEESAAALPEVSSKRYQATLPPPRPPSALPVSAPICAAVSA